MVYLPPGSSDLILILGCVTSNFLYLSFSTLYSSSLWGTDIIVCSKLNKPPVSVKAPPPQMGLKLISPGGGVNRGFTVFA